MGDLPGLELPRLDFWFWDPVYTVLFFDISSWYRYSWILLLFLNFTVFWYHMSGFGTPQSLSCSWTLQSFGMGCQALVLFSLCLVLELYSLLAWDVKTWYSSVSVVVLDLNFTVFWYWTSSLDTSKSPSWSWTSRCSGTCLFLLLRKQVLNLVSTYECMYVL